MVQGSDKEVTKYPLTGLPTVVLRSLNPFSHAFSRCFDNPFNTCKIYLIFKFLSTVQCPRRSSGFQSFWKLLGFEKSGEPFCTMNSCHNFSPSHRHYPLPDHPEFSVIDYSGYREYRLENRKLECRKWTSYIASCFIVGLLGVGYRIVPTSLSL